MSNIDKNHLPEHVAIIMDGNGRWAKNKNLPRTSGHNQGVKVAKRIVKAAVDLGIKNLTLYIFSTENWKRTQDEVGFLMNLIDAHLTKEIKFYQENGIKLHHLGDLEALPKKIQNDIKESLNETKDFDKMNLNMAINYGGRDEIIRGIKKIINQNISEKEINENNFSSFLDMPESPDVDLMIRTGGELRLSNYLLWHLSYAEQIFCDTLWPDYTEEEFYSHIQEFQNRHRRFGAEK